jgi:hypothetical protein
MYPYLPGPASALTLAALLTDRDVADAAARSEAARVERVERQARRDTARATRPALRARGTVELHRWLLEPVSRLHLHRRPTALP